MFFNDVIPIAILGILKKDKTWINREHLYHDHILTWIIREDKSVIFITKDDLINISDSVLKNFKGTPKYVIVDNINNKSYLL